MESLKDIGGTVIRNQDSEIWMLGSDQRIYRHTYHKHAVCKDFPEGTVVRMWYDEPGHNDISVKAVEEFDSPSHYAEEDESA